MVRQSRSSSRARSRKARHPLHQPDYNEDPEVPDDVFEPRFEYSPKNFVQRLFVGLGIKTKLASSTIIQLPHRKWIRWALIVLLVLIAVFLTPQLLPSWLGFHVAEASDLCKNQDIKIEQLRRKMENMSKIPQGRLFVRQAHASLECMNNSAAHFWEWPTKVSYPSECIPANARASTLKYEHCIEPVCTEVCVDFIIFKRIVCNHKCTKRTCRQISAANPNSEKKIQELTAKLNWTLPAESKGRNTTLEVTENAGKADKQAQKIIKRLFFHFDLASNLYIMYSMLSIAVGIPVVVHKRAIASRLLRFTLGLKQSHFVFIVIILLSVWDIGYNIVLTTNIGLHLKNFKNDPCYLDPNFSAARLNLIKDTCGNVTYQKADLHNALTSMTKVYYHASLCEECQVGSIGRNPNPDLIAKLDTERKLYIEGNTTGYMHPASCNASFLNQETSDAPESGVSFAKAFLASGILAQIMLKAVLSSWLVHLFGFIEPMTLHAGKVEIFGIPKGSEATLTPSERKSVKRFARDKHILPLTLFTLLMAWVVVVIVYSAVQGKSQDEEARANTAASTLPVAKNTPGLCFEGRLLLENYTAVL